MIHLILVIVCIISFELFIRLNFINLFAEIIKWSKKSINLLKSSRISDHWKEVVIPVYALKIMKISLLIFFILSIIIILFISANYFYGGLIIYLLSIYGIFESIIIVYLYSILRKFLHNYE